MSADDGLFAGVTARGAAAREVTGEAWLRALLDAEAALARALAACGVAPVEDAEAIAAACRVERFSVESLAAEGAASANPVVPLVRALRLAVGEGPAAWVHRGATSQDILDSAAMLVARRALAPLLDDLRAGAHAAATLARDHRDTVMAGRTLLQQAVPVTFGLVAAGWMAGLDEVRLRLAEVGDTRLAAQLGGAAGTLAALGEQGLAVRAAFARELGLAEPVLAWHAQRARIAELAGALGAAAGAAGKVAGDVVLLSQTEVGEVREAAGGGSSAMPHKHNPVAAVSARACARAAPGLVATLLGSMDHEHQRAAGAWQAEWAPFSALLRSCGSAAAWLRTSLEGLEVDTGRMTANLDATGGRILAERVAGALGGGAEAHALVARAAAAPGSFAAALRAEGAALGDDELWHLLDPAGATGLAGELVDRAVRAHEEAKG
jgi:3-carboxy-cis,cis-muconate cycloisomerase